MCLFGYQEPVGNHILFISQVSIAGPIEGVEDARRRIRVSGLTIIRAEPVVAFLSLSKFNFLLL